MSKFMTVFTSYLDLMVLCVRYFYSGDVAGNCVFPSFIHLSTYRSETLRAWNWNLGKDIKLKTLNFEMARLI